MCISFTCTHGYCSLLSIPSFLCPHFGYAVCVYLCPPASCTCLIRAKPFLTYAVPTLHPSADTVFLSLLPASGVILRGNDMKAEALPSLLTATSVLKSPDECLLHRCVWKEQWSVVEPV